MHISFNLIIGEYKLKDKVVKVIDKTIGFVFKEFGRKDII